MRDPVLLEIVKNAFSTIGREMGLAVVRSAYSTMLKEAGDATSAVLDGQGRLISQSPVAPLYHISSMRPMLAEVLKDFPPDTIREGDVFICNDPYRGGIHSNDVALFKPVFFEGQLAFFTAALVHVADIGGMSAGGLPATATEMYHEGMIFPPIKFYQGGEANASLVKIIEANSRTPEKVMGDLRAMLAAANVGEARIHELVRKYGREELRGLVDELIDYAERRTRLEIQRMPPGVYRGSFVIDDDGVEHRPGGFKVQATVTIKDSTFEADFTGTDKQARGPINSALSQSLSGVLFTLRCLIDPTIPMNEGCYRPLKVHFPAGTLVNPRPPAAVNSRIATIMAIIESMLRALSTAFPEKAIASSANVHVSTMTGTDGESGRVWVVTGVGGGSGGVGARSTKDGIDVTQALILASLASEAGGSRTEPLEAEYPVLVQSSELWQDSGGPGKWRGGLGMRRDVKILEPAEVTARIADRYIIPPQGAAGGRPARGGAWVVNAGTPEEVTLPGKVTGYPLKAGDIFTSFVAGGGGFGPPWERDPQLVLEDVLERKVSIEAAARDYGVVIDPETLEIDEAGTRRRRATMTSQASPSQGAERSIGNLPGGGKATERRSPTQTLKDRKGRHAGP